jgi:hypothetical protein
MATMGAFDKAYMMIDCAIKEGRKKGPLEATLGLAIHRII